MTGDRREAYRAGSEWFGWSVSPVAEVRERPRYSVGTWDSTKESFTPQRGLSVPAFNCTAAQLRVALRELRWMGYSAHRRRSSDGTYDDNDAFVLVERTDGAHWKSIRRGWRRYVPRVGRIGEWLDEQKGC